MRPMGPTDIMKEALTKAFLHLWERIGGSPTIAQDHASGRWPRTPEGMEELIAGFVRHRALDGITRGCPDPKLVERHAEDHGPADRLGHGWWVLVPDHGSPRLVLLGLSTVITGSTSTTIVVIRDPATRSSLPVTDVALAIPIPVPRS